MSNKIFLSNKGLEIDFVAGIPPFREFETVVVVVAHRIPRMFRLVSKGRSFRRNSCQMMANHRPLARSVATERICFVNYVSFRNQIKFY